MSNKYKNNIQLLSLGLMQGDYKQIYRAHRNLYEEGTAILPDLEKLILDKDWTSVQYGKQLFFLTGILNLIHDIDEEYSKKIGQKINDVGASLEVNRRISAITNFTNDNFYLFEKCNVEIFISNEIKNYSFVIRKLEKWLSIISKKDLDNLSKLYIVPRNYGYADYTPILCKIIIGWDTSISFINPFAWLFMFNIESSFYREVGHHKFKHSSEKDLDEKREAKQYAFLQLCKSHPFLMKITGKLIRLVGN